MATATAINKPANFMNTVLGTQSGAENIPHALYSFVTDAEGRPELTGGTYNANGEIERVNYAPIDGVSADKQPSYVGKPRSVYFTVKGEETGLEYRLSAKGLQDAAKASGQSELSFEPMQLRQEVKENGGGYRVATVDFNPIKID